MAQYQTTVIQQAGQFGTDGTIVLPSAPIKGNTITVVAFLRSIAPLVEADWGVLSSGYNVVYWADASNDDGLGALYFYELRLEKLMGESESSTQNVIPSDKHANLNTIGLVAWEISGPLSNVDIFCTDQSRFGNWAGFSDGPIDLSGLTPDDGTAGFGGDNPTFGPPTPQLILWATMQEASAPAVFNSDNLEITYQPTDGWNTKSENFFFAHGIDLVGPITGYGGFGMWGAFGNVLVNNASTVKWDTVGQPIAAVYVQPKSGTWTDFLTSHGSGDGGTDFEVGTTTEDTSSPFFTWDDYNSQFGGPGIDDSGRGTVSYLTSSVFKYIVTH
jgi:hypothetical protein